MPEGRPYVAEDPQLAGYNFNNYAVRAGLKVLAHID